MSDLNLFLIAAIIYVASVIILMFILNVLFPRTVIDNFMKNFTCIPVINTLFIMIVLLVYIYGFIIGYNKTKRKFGE
jgi:uncharacterized membrane protein